METPNYPTLTWAASRVIFGLLSAIGILIGLQYNSIHSDAVAMAGDVSALHHRVAQIEASQQVTAERARLTAESLGEIQQRLGIIDLKLETIGEQLAVLADRSGRTAQLRPSPRDTAHR